MKRSPGILAAMLLALGLLVPTAVAAPGSPAPGEAWWCRRTGG